MHREVWLPGRVRCKHRLWAQRVRQDHFCGQWHDAHQRSEPQFCRLLENHEREHWTNRCSHSVWILCVARFSWWFCSSNTKQKKACNRETVARQRERERKEKVLWSVSHSRCQRKINGTVFVWVWRVSENSILMDEISENIFNEEIDKLEKAENSDQRGWNLTEFHMDIQNLKRRTSEYALTESQRELESQRQQLLEANQCKLNVGEYIRVANWGWRTIFIKKAVQEVAPKLKECQKTLPCYQEEITEQTTKIGTFFTQYDQESRTVCLFFYDLDSSSSFGIAYVSHQALITSSSRKPSREVGMPRNTRESMSFPGNVFDRQHARRNPDELYDDSRSLAKPSGIADYVEDSEKSCNWE